MCIRFSIFEKNSSEFASKIHYMAVMLTKGSIALRFIDPTAMICTFLESQTDLDVHPRKRFAHFGQNCRNLRHRSKHPKQRNSLMWPGQTSSSGNDRKSRPNTSNWVSTRPSASKHVQTRPSTSKAVSKHVQSCMRPLCLASQFNAW